MLMEDIGSLSVTLNLTTFLDGGCPIKYYKIQYKVWGEAVWSNELEHISGLQVAMNGTMVFTLDLIFGQNQQHRSELQILFT